MRRLAILVACLVLAPLAGCGAGYLHTHPHLCPDGEARTHRHWHSEDGYDGHHRPESAPSTHREMAWSD